MPSKFKVFSIPAEGDADREDETNRFLSSNRIVSKRIVFSGRSSEPIWTILIEYYEEGSLRATGSRVREQRDRVDYANLLDPADFAVFSTLREARNARAQKQGIQSFTICTNAEMAEIVRARCRSIADLRKIEGIGDAKAKARADAFLEILQNASYGDESSDLDASTIDDEREAEEQ